MAGSPASPRCRPIAALLLSTVLLLVPLLAGSPAGAADKAKATTVDKLAGQVVLSSRPFPAKFQSDGAFLAAMRRMKTDTFRLDPKRGVEIYFLAFFPFELDELSCEVYVFDVTDKAAGGQSKLVETQNQFLAQRGQRTLASTLTLDPERYEKDHTYRLIVARRSDRGLLAEARFVLRGPR